MIGNLKLPNIRSCKITIVGMGYVGFPLAMHFSRNQKCLVTNQKLDRKIFGYDISKKRIDELKIGIDSTGEINKEEILDNKFLNFSTEEHEIYDSDVFIITVPTPIDDSYNPDFKNLILASNLVGRCFRLREKKNIPLVIYESTVYPGATEEKCIPEIEKESGLKLNFDFCCGYSPERVNPGDKKHTLNNVIKVVSGSNHESKIWIDKLYKSIINAGTKVSSSIRVAEAAKVIENTQRDLNIALVNEFAMIFCELGLDTNEIIDVASTKWNFNNFKPGLVGGHCIGVDPYYLTAKCKEVGYYPQLLLAGRKINEGMSKWIIDRLILKTLKNKNYKNKPNVLILGFTFKANCPDIRNTKIFDMVNELNSHDIYPTIVDPLASIEECMNQYGIVLKQKIPEQKYDLIILTLEHKAFLNLTIDDWVNIKAENGIIFDIKGIVPLELNPTRI